MKHLRITTANIQESVRFRLATPEDVAELLKLYVEFYDAARYKDFLEFDLARARQTISVGIGANSLPHIVAETEDAGIVGFVSFSLDHSFSVQPCAVMHECYVTPAFRRSAIGRYLIGLLTIEAKARGAGALHAPVASGMEAMKSFANLFFKAGFHQLGFVMRKGL